MKVLLTRPKGQNHAMANALTANDVDYVVTPLLAIKSVDNLELSTTFSFENADIVIFTSVNAVAYANNAFSSLTAHPWSQNIAYFAIGTATQKACEAIGIKAISAPEQQQHSEGLLSLELLKNITNKKIIIVRGNGGRNLLAETFETRGAKVGYLEVYQRCCPKLNGEQILKSWQQQGVDTIILPSTAQLNNLISVIPKSILTTELFSWLQSCHIIVSSSRAREQALNYGFFHVTDAQGPDTNAMLKALNI